MQVFRSVLLTVAIILLVLCAGCMQQQESPVAPSPSPATGHAAMLALMYRVTNGTQDSLEALDFTVSDAADMLGKTGLSGPGAEAVLLQVAESDPAIINVITYDANGTVLAEQPGGEQPIVGMSLADTDNVRASLADREPSMSTMFSLAEGGYGAVIAWPVYSSDGNFTGFVSAAFSPYALIAPIAEAAANGTPYTFMAEQVDGRILYDPDPSEVGKMTFSDSLYREFPELARVARNTTLYREGYGTYSFYNTGFGKVVRKETFWSTAGIHGAEWRVLVIGEV